MVTLRDYQLRAIEQLRLHARKRPLLVAPTGSGKGTILAAIMASTVAKGGRGLVVAPTRQIVLDLVERFQGFGHDVSPLMSGERGHDAPVRVASIQTLIRRDFPPANVVLIDEAHLAVAPSYKKVLAHYPFVVGTTATPTRLDRKGLRAAGFGHLVLGPTFQELVRKGFLVDPIVYAPPAPDFDKRLRGGDYTQEALDDYAVKLKGRLVAHWNQYARGRKTVVFACSIAHSKALAADFGFAHIDGSTPRAERARILQDLQEGRVQGITNVGVLGIGWDCPALECAVLARPTASLALYRQQVGRVTRAFPGKLGAIVLDHAGNTHMHGLPSEDIEWSLDSLDPRPPSVRHCPACFFAYVGSPCVCPACGEVLAIEAPEEERATKLIVETDDKLVPFADRRAIYALLVRTASQCKHRLGWARNQYKQRFKCWPEIRMREEEKAYVCAGHEYRPDGTCGRCLRRVPLPEPPRARRADGDPAGARIAP